MIRFRTSAPLTLREAVLPILAMLSLFLAGVLTLEPGTELLIAVLVGAAAVAGLVAVRHGATWNDIQRSTGQKLADVLPMLLILLAIGMLIATWVLAGTIPYLVYWGVQLVQPRYLALTAFLATSIMSVATGTSWGSAGTIGVALMGTAVALDAPVAVVAGAVVSGAYFGDKLSPLSDTTNIAAIGAGADLFRHVRHMLYTTIPSFALGLVLYAAAAGLAPVGPAGLPESARSLLADIEAVYRLSWVVLVPAVVVVWCIARRVPAALAITLSSLVAVIIGIAVQGFGVQDALVSAVAGFDPQMASSVGVEPAALGPSFTGLVARGGFYSMANILIVVIAAFLLAGAMDAAGALDLLIERMLRKVRSIFGLVAATMGSGAVMIALTSHAGVTALIIGGLFQRAYDERELAPENLSRSIEDSVTIIEPLMPWTVSAVFMATTLGVPTLHYAPWAIFCYGGPVFSLLLAASFRRTGFGLRLLEPSTPESARSGAPPC